MKPGKPFHHQPPVMRLEIQEGQLRTWCSLITGCGQVCSCSDSRRLVDPSWGDAGRWRDAGGRHGALDQKASTTSVESGGRLTHHSHDAAIRNTSPDFTCGWLAANSAAAFRTARRVMVVSR